MNLTKLMIDAYMSPLYAAETETNLLEAIRAYEEKLYAFAADHPESMDLVGDSGTRDEYNNLYMAAINGEGVYQTSVVEESDDFEENANTLLDEQIAAEKGKHVLNEMTADYRRQFRKLMETVDPNYEITYASSKITLSSYENAESIEELTYLSEIARVTCDDVVNQLKLKVELIETLVSLVFAWEHSKRKIREGGERMTEFAKAMVVTRKQTKLLYRFLSEDMGMTFDVIMNTPFYKITLLNPQGLDELWKIKKVMHPDNLKATEYVLFEEILSGRTIQEILLAPQLYPYYEMPDPNIYQEIDSEYEKLARRLI